MYPLNSSVTYPEFSRSPVEIPHPRRETQHQHSADAASHYWIYIISLEMQISDTHTRLFLHVLYVLYTMNYVLYKYPSLHYI